jgi:hypothetical protein
MQGGPAEKFLNGHAVRTDHQLPRLRHYATEGGHAREPPRVRDRF